MPVLAERFAARKEQSNKSTADKKRAVWFK